jgi:hypothetical protein
LRLFRRKPDDIEALLGDMITENLGRIIAASLLDGAI